MAKNWRSSKEYREWRYKVINRDKKCAICGSTEKLYAHHIDHATYFKDKRFDVNNGITMCYDCHMNFHNNFKRSYRQKCTKYDLDNFKVLVDYFKEKFSNKN